MMVMVMVKVEKKKYVGNEKKSTGLVMGIEVECGNGLTSSLIPRKKKCGNYLSTCTDGSFVT